MKVQKALNRALILERMIRKVSTDGQVILNRDSLPFLRELKEHEDVLIRRYPKVVAGRRKTRLPEVKQEWHRQVADERTSALLPDVMAYLDRLNKGGDVSETNNAADSGED